MRGAQIIAMWRLIGNGSVLLKVLLIVAFVSALLTFYLQNDRIMTLPRNIGLYMMIFSSILLISNTARVVEMKQARLIPHFRKKLIATLALWFLFSAIYIQILMALTGSAYVIDENIPRIMLTFLTVLAIVIMFDRRSVFFVFAGLFLMVMALGKFSVLGLPDWIESLLYAVRTPLVKSVPLIALVSLLHWTFSKSHRPKLLTSVINRFFSKASDFSVDDSVYDVIALNIFRRNQSRLFHALCCCMTGAVVYYLLDNIKYTESNLELAGTLLIIELALICMIQKNSIYHLRNLWLKGVGDRSVLFAMWETKKNQELFTINASLVVINLVIVWLHSIASELILPIVLCVLALSFFATYLIALATAYYWNITTALLSVLIITVLILSTIFIFSDTLNLLVSSFIWVIVIALTLMIRTQLKKQVSRLDWLLMPKPRANGLFISG
jgi:hypothetical protein